MAKHRRQGKSRFCGFNPVAFYSNVLVDLREHIKEDSPLLHEALNTDLDTFRDCVTHKVQNAESLLSEGGLYRYAALRQVEALIKKNVDVTQTTAETRRRRALDKFFDSEDACRRANRRLTFYRSHWTRAPLGHSILEEAAMLIQRILGEFSPQVYCRVLEQAAHGNGSTFSATSVEHRQLYHKIAGPHSVTRSAIPVLADYFKFSPHWYEYLWRTGQKYEVVRGNRVTTVPKDSQIDRVIAVEPSLNMFLQKGFDSYIKQKLSRIGVNLRDQRANSVVARKGSIDGKHSTVDLSSASDTIPRELVKLLLPSDWFSALDSVRSAEYTVDKGATWRKYEKFSSMGNATTFPIETLIFYSIAYACLGRVNGDKVNLRVYGDDIVTDVASIPMLYETLVYAGFTVNVTKSYTFGPFRETCGTDFVSGIDVRPVYLKSNPKQLPQLYNLYNRLLLKSKFSLPRALSYLEGCVRNPHRGPGYYLMGDSWKWGDEENVEFSAYLISDPPPGKYSKEYQTTVWKVRHLRVSRRPYSGAWDSYARYLCFLLGIEQGYIYSVRTRFKECTSLYTHWPSIRAVLERLRS